MRTQADQLACHTYILWSVRTDLERRIVDNDEEAALDVEELAGLARNTDFPRIRTAAIDVVKAAARAPNPAAQRAAGAELYRLAMDKLISSDEFCAAMPCGWRITMDVEGTIDCQIEGAVA